MSWISAIRQSWRSSRTAGRSRRVAEHFGVARQTVHRWIARHNSGGVLALADASHRPHSCSHQISPELEALICEIRRLHPGWGPRRILHELGRRGIEPLPGRSSIYRCLKRHNLVELRRRKKRRDEFRRWERDRPMQLWQVALDAWVDDYNNERPHQALEMEVPAHRFRLVPVTKDPSSVPVYSEEDQNGQWVLRRVGSNGVMSVDNQMFSVGNAYKGQLVDTFVDDTTIQVWHQNHLLKTVARLRKGPVRKVRADGLRVPDQAEPKRRASGGT